MDGFIQKYGTDVTGSLSGWDRLMFRGTLRALAVASGMMNYLSYLGVLLKDFGGFVEQSSQRLKSACVEAATRCGRPVVYLSSSQTRKEDVAGDIARADGIGEGLIALLTCVEPCMSYSIRKDRASKKLVLEPALRKCLHFYHYFMDADFGLMHVRYRRGCPSRSRSVSTAVRGWRGRWTGRA